MIEQYQQILSSLASRETVTLATMIEGVSMVTRMLKVHRNATELQAVLAKNGMIETLLDVMKESRLDTNLQKMLLPVIISRISQLLRDCEAACVRMNKVGGYKRLFDLVGRLGMPDRKTLEAILSMSTHGSDHQDDKLVKNIEPITYLLKWIAESDFENHELQVWLTESLLAVCSASIQNRMLCCQSGTILNVLNVLQRHERLHGRSAVALLRLVECLGAHSISPYELKKLIMLLQERSESGEPGEEKDSSASSFPLRSHVIHVMSSMAKNDGYDVCRQYFDIGRQDKGLSVPNIREWQPGPVSGFSFHCWIRLDNPSSGANRGVKEERRQLYRYEQPNSNSTFETLFGTFKTAGNRILLPEWTIFLPLSNYVAPP